MSSTQIQLDKLSDVSVHTQSITARSSVRNGIKRNLDNKVRNSQVNETTGGTDFCSKSDFSLR